MFSSDFISTGHVYDSSNYDRLLFAKANDICNVKINNTKE